jgi:hypothetical protein
MLFPSLGKIISRGLHPGVPDARLHVRSIDELDEIVDRIGEKAETNTRDRQVAALEAAAAAL